MSITRDHATKIAKKLNATIEPSGAHRIAYIEHAGVIIAQFGIRHGSNRNQGHGHIPEALFLNQHKTLKLAQCSISKEEWLEELRQKGKLPGGGGDDDGGVGDEGEDENDDEDDTTI